MCAYGSHTGLLPPFIIDPLPRINSLEYNPQLGVWMSVTLCSGLTLGLLKG